MAASVGVILAAVYMLLLFQKLFYGERPNSSIQYLRDIKGWEAIGLAVLAILIVWGGMAPSTFTQAMETSANATRMMAINSASKRPSWLNQEESIGEDGSLYASQDGVVILISKPKYHQKSMSAELAQPSPPGPAVIQTGGNH